MEFGPPHLLWQLSQACARLQRGVAAGAALAVRLAGRWPTLGADLEPQVICQNK